MNQFRVIFGSLLIFSTVMSGAAVHAGLENSSLSEGDFQKVYCTVAASGEEYSNNLSASAIAHSKEVTDEYAEQIANAPRPTVGAQLKNAAVTVYPYVYNTSEFLINWVGVPSTQWILSHKIAQHGTPSIVKGGAFIASFGVGYFAGPLAAKVFYSTVCTTDELTNHIPGVRSVKDLAITYAIKKTMDYTPAVIKGIVGVTKVAASAVKGAYSGAKSIVSGIASASKTVFEGVKTGASAVSKVTASIKSSFSSWGKSLLSSCSTLIMP